MADSPTKGAFRADIPADAVEEALRSVERVQSTGQPTAEAEIAPEEAGFARRRGEGEARAILEPEGGESAREQSLAAQLELSQQKGRETLEKLKEEHDRYLRAAAELENYRKRAQKERDEVLRYGNEKLLKDLFPVVDNLDRALAAVGAAEEAGSACRRGEGEARAIDAPLVKGVTLVRSGLEQVLARYGVTSFSAMGQPFDPAKHEALLQVATADAAPGTVVMEHARGFLLHDRLARPAMVGVAKAPEPAQDREKDATKGSGGGES